PATRDAFTTARGGTRYRTGRSTGGPPPNRLFVPLAFGCRSNRRVPGGRGRGSTAVYGPAEFPRAFNERHPLVQDEKTVDHLARGGCGRRLCGRPDRFRARRAWSQGPTGGPVAHGLKAGSARRA